MLPAPKAHTHAAAQAHTLLGLLLTPRPLPGQCPVGCSGKAAPLPAQEFSSPEALDNPALPHMLVPTWRDDNQSREMAASPGERPEAGDVDHWE